MIKNSLVKAYLKVLIVKMKVKVYKIMTKIIFLIRNMIIYNYNNIIKLINKNKNLKF